MKLRGVSGLALIQGLAAPKPPELEKPELSATRCALLVRRGINPSKQRKGKSGEIPRGR